MASTFGAKGIEFPLDRSPATLIRTGGRFLGGFLMVFALVWGGAPLIGLLSEPSAGRSAGETLLMLIFPAIGTGLFLFGLHTFLWRKEITIDKYFVAVVERGLKGRREWQETLDAYRGVLRRSRRVKTKNSSYTVYMVDLVHEDQDRTINLYSSRSEQGWRGKWEAYARHFRKPALEESADGMVAREAGDLDKPVGELMREGKIEVDLGALTEKAEGLAVDFEGDTIVITRTGPRNSLFGSVLALLFPLIFIYIGFFHDDGSQPVVYIFGVIGIFFQALTVILVAWDQVSRHRLRIGPRTLRLNQIGPWGETKGKTLPVEQIENVKIGREQGSGPTAVIASGDSGMIKFGTRLPRASLDFIHNTILAKIGKHHAA